MYALKFFLAFTTALTAFGRVQAMKTYYYWKEYTGEVPDDAVEAGQDINGSLVYIGQAYVNCSGLIVAQIAPGRKQVNVPIFGIQKIDKHVKILCGPRRRFYWMKTDAKTLHLALIDKHVVIGGHESNLGYLGIGRITYDGEVRIGKVNMFSAEEAYIFYDADGEEKGTSSYQILMYGDGWDYKTWSQYYLNINSKISNNTIK